MVQSIYRDLTGLELPSLMRPVERRTVDAVLVTTTGSRILEVDEIQHFNAYRAATLSHYVGRIPLAFDPASWIEHSNAKERLEGGGFAKPKPPLFPGDGLRRQYHGSSIAVEGKRPIWSSPRSLPRSTRGPWSRASAAAGRACDRKAFHLCLARWSNRLALAVRLGARGSCQKPAGRSDKSPRSRASISVVLHQADMSWT
jgi:hypothetical protein